MRQAQKMEAVGQLTGGIAHDFNNMLTVITGTIEILAEAVAEKPQLAAIAKLISEAADRGAELTQHLLAFARKQPLQPRETDINTLIMEPPSCCGRRWASTIEIESAFADEGCLAGMVDPNQLTPPSQSRGQRPRRHAGRRQADARDRRDVLSTKITPAPHSDVRPGNYMLIAVSDTGTAFRPAILDKVFDPFFTTKGAGKGTGLGLSMVYGFVKQSGGHIKIYSEEGHGTTIKMYLPPSDGRPLRRRGRCRAGRRGRPRNDLVVEDDKLVRDYVLTQLH